MSSQHKVNFDKDNFSKCFQALAKVHSYLANMTIQSSDRQKHAINTFSNMVFHYVPRSTDDMRINANGGLDFTNIIRTDWLHNKISWQLSGINAGSLPDILDLNGNPAPMTMNGIPIDITDIKVRGMLRKMTNFLSEITMEALQVILNVMEKFIVVNPGRLQAHEPLAVLILLQNLHIKVQNKLHKNKARIEESLQNAISKLPSSHAEAIAAKNSIKLNLAMLEQAKCMLAGQKDHEVMSNYLDNIWGLLNKSSLLATTKQEMTCLVMELRRDRDMGQYMELDHVLDRIISVFSNDEDEPEEELAAMLVADVPVMRNDRRATPSIQNSPDAQGLMEFKETLDKILRLVGDVKSELGYVRKFTNPEYTKNVEANVQRRKQPGQRNNENPTKQRSKFANVAIQKPQNRKSYPIPLVGRVLTAVESDDEAVEEVAQLAEIVKDIEPPFNIRIMTAHNKESVLGSAFSRFQWLDSGEGAIGNKIGTTLFNSMRIDHDTAHHNAGQSSNINEPLGYYPFNEKSLVSKHDDKEMSNDEDENDYLVNFGKYHPKDISVPGSMEAAERAQERQKLRMEILRGLADERPAATSTCSAPETSSARMVLQAVFSPSAPQVEYNQSDYMAYENEEAQDLHAPKGHEPDQDSIMRHETQAQDLHAPKGREPDQDPFMSRKMRAQDLHAPKGRGADQDPIERRVTRSITRVENLNIPTAAVPSDSEEENVDPRPKRIIVTPFGSSLSPKAFLEQAQRRSPMTLVSNYVSAIQARHLDHLKDDTVRYASHSRLHSARPADWEDGEM